MTKMKTERNGCPELMRVWARTVYFMQLWYTKYNMYNRATPGLNGLHWLHIKYCVCLRWLHLPTIFSEVVILVTSVHFCSPVATNTTQG